jgi:3-oxoacyl-[acyl-carrier protein] reductase
LNHFQNKSILQKYFSKKANMDSGLHLREKTAILTGPLTQLHQSLIMRLCELGCNVALLGDENPNAQRYTQQISDQREIHPHFGRATTLDVNFSKEENIADAISRAAEAFGGVDIYIDGLFHPDRGDFKTLESPEKVQSIVKYELLASLNATQTVLRFLKGRRRGRILYLLQDLTCQGFSNSMVHAAARGGLIPFSQALAAEVKSDNVTVNCLRMGLTEEFLLSVYPGKNLTEAEAELRKSYPQVELLRADELSSIVAFLVSPLAQVISGQSIVAHRGLI